MTQSVIQALRNGDVHGAIYAILQSAVFRQEDGSFPVSGRLFTPVQTVTYESSVTLDLATSCAFTITLTGDVTFENPENADNGSTGFIVVKQDESGAHSAFWGSNFRVQSSANLELTGTADSIDIFAYVVVDGLIFISKTADWVAVP